MKEGDAPIFDQQKRHHLSSRSIVPHIRGERNRLRLELLTCEPGLPEAGFEQIFHLDIPLDHSGLLRADLELGQAGRSSVSCLVGDPIRTHKLRPLLPVIMANCMEDDGTMKRNNSAGYQNSSDQLVTPKSRQRVQRQSSDNSASGQGSFYRYCDTLQVPDISSSNNLHQPTRSSADHQVQQPLAVAPLEALMEELEENTAHNDNADPIQNITTTMTTTTTSPTTHHRKGVKNAGKKVLQVAVTRPWKSVKRRLIGGTVARHELGDHSHGSSYGAVDELFDNPTASSLGHHRAGASAAADHSEMSATSFPRLGGSPLPSSVRELLSPTATMRDLANRNTRRSNSPTESVLVASEYVLRCAVLLLLAFLLGAHYQQQARYMAKLAEYLVVAWLTCAALRWTAAWNEDRHLQQLHTTLETFEVASDGEHEALLSGGDGHNQRHKRKVHQDEESEQPDDIDRTLVVTESHRNCFEVCHAQSFESTDDEEKAHIGRLYETRAAISSANSSDKEDTTEADSTPTPNQQNVSHPSLNSFYIVNTADNKRVFPNSSDLMFPIDNDYFSGKMLALIRTPDVDDEYAEKGTEENDKASNYFSGRQRRFDFQFEFRVKKIPQGRIYFMIEVDEPVKMGMIQRAFASAALVRATYARLSANIVLATAVIERC